MKPIFVLIRGNSGSGKSVLADELQKYFGFNDCFVIHQDVIRRDILHANDHVGTPTIDLIKTLFFWGESRYKIIVLEGILRKDVYGEMLIDLINNFDDNTFVYYLDVSFSMTIKYNQMKNQPFPVDSLKKWWRANDYLNYKEQRLSNGSTKYLLQSIIQDITDNT